MKTLLKCTKCCALPSRLRLSYGWTPSDYEMPGVDPKKIYVYMLHTSLKRVFGVIKAGNAVLSLRLSFAFPRGEKAKKKRKEKSYAQFWSTSAHVRSP